MASTTTTWTVLPHDRLEPMGSNILTVTGNIPMPLTRLERRMTVVRLRDGRLVVFSPIALDETGMREIEAFGTPAFLVIPNAHHRRDAAPWKARYPSIVVVAPRGAADAVAEVVPVDTSTPEFGDDVRFVEVPGTSGVESALEVREDGRLSLVVNDVVGNLPPDAGLVLRAMGFAGRRPRIPRAARMTMVDDPKAFAEQLRRWADEPVERLLVSHGRPVTRDVPSVLRELAASL